MPFRYFADLSPSADRRRLATGAQLLGDSGVVEVEGERRHRRPRNYRGSSSSSSAAFTAMSRSPLYASSAGPVRERKPSRVCDLDLHSSRQRADATAPRVGQEEAHDLEDALAVPRVDVADVARASTRAGPRPRSPRTPRAAPSRRASPPSRRSPSAAPRCPRAFPAAARRRTTSARASSARGRHRLRTRGAPRLCNTTWPYGHEI